MSFSANDLQVEVDELEDHNSNDYDEGNHFFADGGTITINGNEQEFISHDAKSASYSDNEYEGSSTSECWYVIKHQPSQRLFIRTGSYSSYDGYDFNRVKEVEETLKSITFQVYSDKTGKVIQRGKEL